MAFNNTSELPDSQIEYRDNESGGRRLITLLIYIVLALVVATLVFFAQQRAGGDHSAIHWLKFCSRIPALYG
jgi:hypothetical protein